jgi:hypothetical protein
MPYATESGQTSALRQMRQMRAAIERPCGRMNREPIDWVIFALCDCGSVRSP